MVKKIKRCLLSAVLVGTLLLTGCTGTDVNTRSGISVVREETGAQYSLTTVRQGDVVLTETVRVKYFAASSKNYGFAASGLYYDTFLVSIGDEVKAGDVLATLDCEAIDAEIAARENAIDEHTRDLERNRQLLALFDERQGDKPLTAEDSARRHGYETAIRDAESEIAIISTELDQLRTERANRVIVADIDGTVTYVREVEPGETSINGRVVITITDLDSCAFTASVEHPECLSADEIYTATISGVQYDIVLATPEELGIEPEPMNAQSTLTRVYFAPLIPSVNLSEGESGSFTITVDSSSDVLYIPVTALTEVEGETCVYVLNENGIMTVRPVSVGLVTARYAEITEGLEAGEEVVLY